MSNKNFSINNRLNENNNNFLGREDESDNDLEITSAQASLLSQVLSSSAGAEFFNEMSAMTANLNQQEEDVVNYTFDLSQPLADYITALKQAKTADEQYQCHLQYYDKIFPPLENIFTLLSNTAAPSPIQPLLLQNLFGCINKVAKLAEKFYVANNFQAAQSLTLLAVKIFRLLPYKTQALNKKLRSYITVRLSEELLLLGLIELGLKQIHKAKAHFIECLESIELLGETKLAETNPFKRCAYIKLADIAITEDDSQLALFYYNKATQLDKTVAQTFAQTPDGGIIALTKKIAQYYYNQSDLLSAIAWFKKSIHLINDSLQSGGDQIKSSLATAPSQLIPSDISIQLKKFAELEEAQRKDLKRLEILLSTISAKHFTAISSELKNTKLTSEHLQNHITAIDTNSSSKQISITFSSFSAFKTFKKHLEEISVIAFNK